MQSLQVFNYKKQEVRFIQKDGQDWWVAKDVCDALEIKNISECIRRLDEDEVSQAEVIDSLGRLQKTNIVNEPGLYKIIFKSEKPEAKLFTRWVTHEVLPSIRKTGSYSMNNSHPQMTDKELYKLMVFSLLESGATPEEIGRAAATFSYQMKKKNQKKAALIDYKQYKVKEKKVWMTPERQEVINALKGKSEPLEIFDIASTIYNNDLNKINAKYRSLTKLLCIMVQKKLINRVATGKYKFLT